MSKTSSTTTTDSTEETTSTESTATTTESTTSTTSSTSTSSTTTKSSSTSTRKMNVYKYIQKAEVSDYVATLLKKNYGTKFYTEAQWDAIVEKILSTKN